ncbi:hypothetical protein [Salinicola socius]|uniref:Uncharacterized protein n=1 Tax=Salinicola socius TaxID=404433 RepID=A0A1Q8SQX6_9GAMM|nr:hypothetical protein [Salinicola socius]OLO03819.1 hypothetical protein BTW07_13120 [Salinicola socius]
MFRLVVVLFVAPIEIVVLPRLWRVTLELRPMALAMGFVYWNLSAPMASSDRTVRIALPVYVDIKAVTGESGEPLSLPDSYTPEDEQQRLGDLAQNARDIGNTLLSAHKGSGQVAGACLVLWSLIVSWQEGAFVDDEEGADWSKIIGSGVSVASLGLSTEGSIISGIKWAFVGDVLGAAGGMISIWDGLKKLTEASEASKTGQSVTGHYGMIVGGVGVIAGIASIVVISASTGVGLVVGVFFGILTLLLGYTFVAMVSPAVQMWVNRSILGKPSEREDMQVLPFDDMASEQSSLEMVFQGLVVELSWEPAAPDPKKYLDSDSSGFLGFSVDSDARDAEEKRVSDLVRINLKVRVPKLDKIELALQLTPHNSPETIVGWTYQKNRGREALTAGSSRGSLPGGELENRPTFALKDNAYVAEWSQVYAKNVLTQLVDLTIDFKSSDTQSFSQDLLAMRIEEPESERETAE